MRPVLAIHGGAGRIERATLARCKALLRHALESAYAMLQSGAGSLDTVTAAVAILEDSGLFNAGRGASRTTTGRVELDASIMEGRHRRAGGVAAVTRIKNPVLAARAVMERTPHVLLAGQGAESFCRSKQITFVKATYFISKKRKKTGTVGAVALDRNGNLAAATSTGGYWGKLPGRVGDSPLIGAGTYADNRSCAVSCTGVGEFFIRAAAAYDVSARMLHRHESLASASGNVLKTIRSLRGRGGLIAVDRRGNLALPFNTQGMYRAWMTRSGRVSVEVF